MTLREKRVLLTLCWAKLVLFAEGQGYELAIKWAYRCEECPVGRPTSLHKRGPLAIDGDLYRNGKWLSSTAAHQPLGAYWKSLHPLCRWGGDFGDGNHYSIEHGGMR